MSTIGSIPGIIDCIMFDIIIIMCNNLHGLGVINYLSHIVIYSLQNLLFGFRCHAVIIRNIYLLWRWKYISISLICNYKWVIMLKSMLLLLVNTDNINYLTRLPTDQNYECYGC